MSIRIMTAIWDIELPDSEKLVALALADWCDDNGKCWPSVAQIAKKCSKSERTVQAVLKSLETKGKLTREMIAGKGTIYHLTPAAAAPVNPRKDCTPAKSAPVQGTTQTPAAAAPNTSIHTISSEAKASSDKRAQEIPDGWQPAQFGPRTQSRAIVDGWPPGELEIQLEHFAAHHRKNGAKFKNWQDAWSTWVFNSRKFGGKDANHRQRSTQSSRPGDGMLNALRDLGSRQARDPHAAEYRGSRGPEGVGEGAY